MSSLISEPLRVGVVCLTRTCRRTHIHTRRHRQTAEIDVGQQPPNGVDLHHALKCTHTHTRTLKTEHYVINDDKQRSSLTVFSSDFCY